MPVPWFVGALASQGGGSFFGVFGTAIGTITNSVAPINRPPLEAIQAMYLAGEIGLDGFKAQCRMYGYTFSDMTGRHTDLLHKRGDVYEYYHPDEDGLPNTCNIAWMRTIHNVPTIDEIVQAEYRGLLGSGAYINLMMHNGVNDLAMQQLYKDLGRQIPGPSDLVRFAVREGFTPAIVEQYRYMDELPTQALQWFAKQGLNYDIGIARPAGVDGNGAPIPAGQATWFDLYWWSHWELPSVGQAYEMTWRYYPASPHGASPDYTPEVRFTSEDLSTLLKTQDYPTYWRKRLEGISYSPLTRVDVRRMFELDVVNEDAVYHAYRAIGYNDRNAEMLLKFAIEKKKLAQIKLTQAFTVPNIIKYYKLGVMTEQEARARLVQVGIKPLAASNFIQKAAVEVLAEQADKTIKLMHKAFLNGHISTADARTVLTNAGIENFNIEQNLSYWLLERKYTYKNISAGEIIKSYKLDLISEDETIRQLQVLGYDDGDVAMIVLNAKREKLDKRNQQIIRAAQVEDKGRVKDVKEQTKQAKETAAQADKAKKEREKATKQAETMADKLRKRQVATLTAPYTDANIKAMFAAKVLTEQQVRDILTIKEWTKEGINKFITGLLTKPEKGDTADALPQETEAKPPPRTRKPTDNKPS